MARFRFLPCLDSDEMAAARKLTSWIDRDLARSLGERAVVAAEDGFYFLEDGSKVAWRTQVERARASRISIAPEAPLPLHVVEPVEETVIQVANKTTLQAGRELVDAGHRPLALNFANGITRAAGFFQEHEHRKKGCAGQVLFLSLCKMMPCTNFTGHGPAPIPRSGVLSLPMCLFSGMMQAMRLRKPGC